jgi:ABC-2 type transport system ATP-binding protein
MDDVAALAQRVVVIDQGQKIYDGGLRDLTEHFHPEKQFSVVFNKIPDDKFIASLGKLLIKDGLFFKFSVDRTNVAEIAAKLYSNDLIADLSIEDPPLEDLIGELFVQGAATSHNKKNEITN